MARSPGTRRKETRRKEHEGSRAFPGPRRIFGKRQCPNLRRVHVALCTGERFRYLRPLCELRRRPGIHLRRVHVALRTGERFRYLRPLYELRRCREVNSGCARVSRFFWKRLSRFPCRALELDFPVFFVQMGLLQIGRLLHSSIMDDRGCGTRGGRRVP